MTSFLFRCGLISLSLSFAAPAMAGNALMAPGAPVAVAKSGLTVTPDREWNRLSARPGRSSETWTIDGDDLNGLNFYGGVESGRALFREVNKRAKPLPKFSSTMLLTDVADLLENSYRVALDTSIFTMTSAEPVPFLGGKGIRFRYIYRRTMDDVARNGEATATILNGKLYMISFEGPSLFYFGRDVEAYRHIVDTARLGAKPA